MAALPPEQREGGKGNEEEGDRMEIGWEEEKGMVAGPERGGESGVSGPGRETKVGKDGKGKGKGGGSGGGGAGGAGGGGGGGGKKKRGKK